MPSAKLFTPIKVGDVALQHRVVLAPLTRLRANRQHVPSDLMVQYYSQRANTPGTLLITEATYIAQRAGGNTNAPGIWSDDQVKEWKKITNAVHAKGSYIYLQLWAMGRAANPEVLREEDPSLPYVSASDVALSGQPAPRPLTIPEVKEYVQLFAKAAANAVHRAGFDGVEIHGATGYLVDQFLQDVTNRRTDEYGGSVENRARFALEIVDAIANEIGEQKTAIRLSPWGRFNDMRMGNPKPQFSYVVHQLIKRHPSLAYLHVVEPRLDSTDEEDSNDFIRDIWGSRPLISAGGYTRATAVEQAEKRDELIAFGRAFIANPDLPYRLRKNIPLTVGNRDTYYTVESSKGYIDYPFANAAPVDANKNILVKASYN